MEDLGAAMTPGAGERARELAAAFDFECIGSDDHDFENCEKCERMRKRLTKLLTETIEAAEFATEKDCLKVVQRAYYEAYAKSDRLNMRVCAEIEKHMKESQGERHLAGALAAVRLEEARWWDEHPDINTTDTYDRFQRMRWLERAVEGK